MKYKKLKTLCSPQKLEDYELRTDTGYQKL